MADDQLRELRRKAKAAPDDGPAWLQLAKGLARVGHHEDAVEAAHRASVFGAEPSALFDAVDVLRQRVSPWIEKGADAQCSRRADVRGPRAPRVAARARPSGGSPVAVDLDGSLLASSRSELVRLDPHTLEERAQLPLHDPVVTSRGAFALAQRVRGARPVRHGPAPLLLLPVSGRGPTWEAPADERPHTRGESPPVVDTLGRVHAGDWALGPDLAPVARHAAKGRPVRAISVARDGRVALLGDRGVELLDLNGKTVSEWPHLDRPTFDDTGGLLLVEREPRRVSLFAVDPEGKTAWQVRLEKARPDSTVTVALAERGACYVSWSWPTRPVIQGVAFQAGRLARIERGRIAWTRELHEASALVVDREGVAYTCGPPERKTWRPGLVAYDPEGETVLHVPARRARAFLIDSLGRLIASLDDGVPAVVAIG